MHQSRIRLTPLQRSVVEHENGALLVVAGPGSGKTLVLTERIARLLSLGRNFHVLALTFTNKAASEMRERLKNVSEAASRVQAGTLHSFCTGVLADRGRHVGVVGVPMIFNSTADRRQLLVQAVADDPLLKRELISSGDLRAQGQLLDSWIRSISLRKSHPISAPDFDDDILRAVYESYDGALRACNAFDFDDLLLLTFRLFIERPKIADFYRRLYAHMCIDEAQDLNEAQYAVITTLAGPDYRNVMLVGDPRQSIYGFNTSDPRFMEEFRVDFNAKVIELTENFRCSRSVVAAAQALDSDYKIEGQLPIEGEVVILEASDESEEATDVISKINDLRSNGHDDVGDQVDLEQIAVLGRTRFALLKVEELMRDNDIEFYRALSANLESQTELFKDFESMLRVAANPQDTLHLGALLKRWDISLKNWTPSGRSASDLLTDIAAVATQPRASVICEAVTLLLGQSTFDITSALRALRDHGAHLADVEKRSVWEDAEVWSSEWDAFLRSSSVNDRGLQSFLSFLALGSGQEIRKGIALLTVHSSKGLEFDVVFVVGMAEGTFPDYRAKTQKTLAEEARNAFVAVTRSRRVLYLSYPKSKIMPWGDVWQQKPSRFLRAIART